MKISSHSCFIAIFILMHLTLPLQAQFFRPAQPKAATAQIKSWLEKEMVYPVTELENRTRGVVKLEFIVDKKGNSSQFIVKEGVSPAIDKEAIRLVSKIVWDPATDGGQKVDAKHNYEIRFRPRQYNRLVRKRGYHQMDFPYLPVDTSGTIFNFAALDKRPEPQFEKENMNLNQYIRQELNYPSTALSRGISGTVTLGYIIEEHGLVSNIHLIHSVGGGCDNEAIRMLESINWMPGIKDGKAVRSRSQIDITFQLPDGSRQQAIPSQQQSGL